MFEIQGQQYKNQSDLQHLLEGQGFPGRGDFIFRLGVAEVELALAEQLDLLPRGEFAHQFGRLFPGDGVAEFVVHFVVEIDMQFQLMGLGSFDPRGLAEPDVVVGVLEAHPLLPPLQELAHEVLGEGAVVAPDGVVEVGLAFGDLLDGGGVVLGLERSVSCDHFEHCDSQCPKIDPFIVPSSEVDLRGLIEVGADHGEHIPPHSPLVGLLADAEVDDLDGSGERAIQNILGFYIPMAYIPMMQILQRPDQLLHDHPQFLLTSYCGLAEAGLVEALHDEEGAVLVEVEVERAILDDGRMSEFLEVDEIPFEVEDVFFFEFDLLGCVDLARFQVLAPVDACVRSFPQFLQKLVFLEEGVQSVFLGVF